MEQSFIEINENMADMVVIKDNVYLHKQVEFRDGKTYMRIKKRILASGA